MCRLRSTEDQLLPSKGLAWETWETSSLSIHVHDYAMYGQCPWFATTGWEKLSIAHAQYLSGKDSIAGHDGSRQVRIARASHSLKIYSEHTSLVRESRSDLQRLCTGTVQQEDAGVAMIVLPKWLDMDASTRAGLGGCCV